MMDVEDMRIMRLDELKELLGVSKSTIYNWMKDGNFPQSVSLGPRTVGWLSTDISGWLNERSKNL